MSQHHDPLLDMKRQICEDIWQSLSRSRRIASLLDRVGLDPNFWNSAPPCLPAGAQAYLVDSNPRLLELRELYRTSSHPAARHSQWTTAVIASDLPLQAFRGDCAFIWQRRDWNLPIVHLLTAYYLEAAGAGPLMRSLGEDNLFGIYTVPYRESLPVSRDLLDSVSEIRFLDKWLGLLNGTLTSVLDIGAGYGRLAHRILQAVPKVRSYICADAIPESTFICEYYLRFRGMGERAHAVTVFDLDTALNESKPQLAISVHSLGECRRDVIRWWMGFLKQHSVKYLLLVLNPCGVRGETLVSTESNGMPGLPFQFDLREAGYLMLAREPKYLDSAVQQFGVSPAEFLLYERC